MITRFISWIERKSAPYIARIARNHIEQALQVERTRVWNDLFTHSSVQPWREGDRIGHIIHIGSKKLEEIIFPPIPTWYKEVLPMPDVAPPVHPSLKR